MIYPEGTTPYVSDSRQRWLNKIVEMGGGTAAVVPGTELTTEDGSTLTTEDGSTLTTE